MITINAEKNGPDYTTRVEVTVEKGDLLGSDTAIYTEIYLSLADARTAFSMLGEALKLIDANADPS